MRELFIEELAEVQGGGRPPRPCPCCGVITTMACCEETTCDSCCPPTS